MEEEFLGVNGFDKDHGKFIQAEIKGKMYLWFGPSELLHGHIFKDLLDDLKIPYETFKESFVNVEDERSIVDIPERRNFNYNLEGAGSYFRKNGVTKFYGTSTSYGIGPDKWHLEKISKLTGLEFIVER